jgi:hypothetical protein
VVGVEALEYLIHELQKLVPNYAVIVPIHLMQKMVPSVHGRSGCLSADRSGEE